METVRLLTIVSKRRRYYFKAQHSVYQVSVNRINIYVICKVTYIGLELNCFSIFQHKPNELYRYIKRVLDLDIFKK